MFSGICRSRAPPVSTTASTRTRSRPTVNYTFETLEIAQPQPDGSTELYPQPQPSVSTELQNSHRRATSSLQQQPSDGN